MVQRAFKYQTGELIEISRDLLKNGMVEVDVMNEDRIKPFLKDLEGFDIRENPELPWDYEAINFYDDKNFVCRVFMLGDSQLNELYIDFYCDYNDDSYDPIFYG